MYHLHTIVWSMLISTRLYGDDADILAEDGNLMSLRLDMSME